MLACDAVTDYILFIMGVNAIALAAIIIMTGWAIQPGSATEEREVCSGEHFEATCSTNEVLVIQSARYGRMKLGRCVKRDVGYLGCAEDVLRQMDGLCSGRDSCQILVTPSNPVFAALVPCMEELKSYLEVEYTCTKVATTASGTCHSTDSNELQPSSAILASHVTDESGCGGLGTPWVIRTSPGQRVSLYITDFDWHPEEEEATKARCQPYGYISEPGLGVNQTVCGGLARERQVYMSSSSHVVIQILPTSQRQLKASFLLSYSVIGCPDVTPPANAWYKRDGDAAVIGCEWSEHSWHLTCEGNTWVGVVGNCSTKEAAARDMQRNHQISTQPTSSRPSCITPAGL